MTTVSDTTYQGWTNYETWAVKLWIDNERSTYEYWREVAADNMRRARMYPHDVFTVSEDARFGLADTLKDEFEQEAEGVLSAASRSASVWADLLNAALGEVNWTEIADNMLSDAEGYETEA